MTDAPRTCYNVRIQCSDGYYYHAMVYATLDRAKAQASAELLEYRCGCSAIVVSWIVLTA